MTKIKKTIWFIFCISLLSFVVGIIFLCLYLNNILLTDSKFIILSSVLLSLGTYEIIILSILIIKLKVMNDNNNFSKQNIKVLKILSILTLYRYLIRLVINFTSNNELK